MSTRTSPGTPILVGASVVVVLALLAMLALSRSSTRSYGPDTPEAAAQGYLQAVFDDDTDLAHTYLSSELRTKCSSHDFDWWWAHQADSATFEEVRVEGDHAEIELRLTSNDYEHDLFPFPDYNHSRETELELDRIEGGWVITDATWPLAGCTWR